ncbi:myosin-binding protein 2-like [Impatiens glandulifera]|uniref:myosin-binding protein 2-like n=1 Tax=Impatiens glandulifera TaxID=253017 RepID=UPI001FB04F3F|nr:myosin-binding protein 2-like [Impatiens glandulifera]
MAANKFATMVHRNTNNMTLILVYSLLEWVLILLLLINALFSYLIVRFADYFGLKPPCPLCSRIDHFLNPKEGKSFYRDLLCEDHASEVSNSSYCLNHRKLTDSLTLCEDCSSSGLRQENCEVGSELCLCSCCGLRFDFNKGEVRIEKGNDSEMDLEDFFKGKDIDGSSGFQHLEYFLGNDGFNLIPIELIDPTTDEEQLHEMKREVDLVFEPGLVVYNRSCSFDGKETDPSAYDESTKLVIVHSMKIQEDENSIVFNSENCVHDKPDDVVDGDGNRTTMAAAATFEEKETDPSADDESTKLVILDRMEIQENENLIDFNSENYDQDKLDIDVGHQEAMTAATEKEEEDEPTKLVVIDRNEIQEYDNSIVLNSENYDQDKLDIDVGHQAAMAAATVKEEEDEPTNLVLLGRMDIQENENSTVLNSENYDQDKLDIDVGHQAAMAAANVKEEEDEPTNLVLLGRIDIQENENSTVLNSENYDQDKLDIDIDVDDDVGHQAAMAAATEKEDEPTNLVLLRRIDIQENENSIVFNSENYDQDKLDIDVDVCHQADMAAAAEEDEEDEEEEFPHMAINETEADVSIGTEIPDLVSSSSSSNSDNFHGEKDHDDHDQYELETIELKPISVGLTDQHFCPNSIEEDNDQCRNIIFKTMSSEINEPNEEKAPETPTSSDSFNFLQKKLLLSTTDESLDGSSSVVSEAEGIDGMTSVDRLKSALRSERKALYDLYTELEEERSASAVAANQTMAMINRLQEEKAAMQMEALQYQRMMEEQSEYDQEALQLMSELVVKREREKQEVERELEVYRKRVMEYESKKKMRHSSSSSSLDLNQNTPVEEVFEGDRVQILEHLKVLEGKLFSLDDDEENGYHHDHDQEGRLMGVKGKKLLPLFDAISDENGESNGHENGYEYYEISERVQALEADREFLKNCISSLKKGDEGMDLLREILQHLREIRTVNRSLKNITDGPIL